ncbi:3913_t:CDS:1, partial [Scutellospora calospora]
KSLMFSNNKCKECHRLDNSWPWCKDCNARHFEEYSKFWTSGSKDIDDFILDTQLQASNAFQKLEWIPYDQFTDFKFLAKGGSGEVCKATWKDGYICEWNIEKKCWSRKSNTEVALKSLYNLKDTTILFNEIRNQIKSIKINDNKVIPCYGITQNTKTQEFMM